MSKHNTRKVHGVEIPSTEPKKTALAANMIAGGMNRAQRRAAGLTNKDASVAENLIQPPENNTVWDDLNQIAARCGQLLASPGALLPILRNDELMKHVDNMEHLNRTANVLANDLNGFAKFYSGIRAQHANMTGASTNADEHLKAIMLHNDYTVWTEQFEANVRPMIESMTEIIVAAEAKMGAVSPDAATQLSKQVTEHIATHLQMHVVAEEPGMTPEQDPTVITDVEVKETVH